ncbi:hypothetical protein BM525_20790 (plasmid) [Alteromonas mediterranea]|uniref:Uncharacterized protein n=1 Tax=Alteromonas mediterranea TaxID=314275 RepID=A0AAC9JHN3_9ALTE|nr:hypothetical protein [Alteromonas mediterranea]APD92302.1 hypothetical protein BM524_20565 [Alteromonas mediterranea]APE00163.1 hypothetical protein BM525_20790 [Alteromonas mediterranea]
MRFEIEREGISPVNQRGRVSYNLLGTDSSLEDLIGKRVQITFSKIRNSPVKRVDRGVEPHILYIAADTKPYIGISPASALYYNLIKDSASLAMEIATFPNGKSKTKVLEELSGHGLTVGATPHDVVNMSQFGIGSLLDIYESYRPALFSAVVDVIPSYRPSVVYGDLKKHVINYPASSIGFNAPLPLELFEDGVILTILGIVGPNIVSDKGFFSWIALCEEGAVIEESDMYV